MADLPSALLNHHNLADLEKLSGAVTLSEADAASLPEFAMTPKSPGDLPPRKRAPHHRPGPCRHPGRARQGGAPARHRPHHALPEDETIRYRVDRLSNPHHIALDATYSIGDVLSGVGLYSHEILMGLAAAHPEVRFDFYYRPHRYLRARRAALPPKRAPARVGGTAGPARRRSLPRAEPTPAARPDAPRHRHLPRSLRDDRRILHARVPRPLYRPGARRRRSVPMP